MESYKNAIQIVKNDIDSNGIAINKIADIASLCAGIFSKFPEEYEYTRVWTNYVKENAIAQRDIIYRNAHDNYLWLDYQNLYYQTLLLEAQNRVLDSYLLYIEKNREKKDRYYEPRRSCFIKCGLIQGLQDILDDKLDILSISMPPGTGKLLADDTPVLTTEGWKNHGDLVVGDYVFGLDGLPKMVQHVFPKDYADCLVTFSNGEQIQCHENHEWVVFDRHRQKERVIETKELFDSVLETGISGKRGHRYHYMIPEIQSFKNTDKELIVDPYILGAWLGDGTETKPRLTICNTDTCIVDYVKSKYAISKIYEQVGCKSYDFLGLRQDLEKLGMCHSRNKLGKRIPQQYLCASENQRLELLAGLIDTDGTCRKKENKYSFSTSNKELKNGVMELISTFGWRCYCVESEPKVSSSGIVGRRKNYVVSFTPTFSIPCRVERKQLNTFSKKRRIAITSVERVEPKQGNCIQVEDGIYCVGYQMVPTHNSTIEKFFHSGVCGWFPNDYNLFYSHSGDITRMYYDGINDILTNQEEYTWNEIFPKCKVTSTNAKLEQININKYKPFPNVQCTSVGAKNAGKVRASKFLLCDDLIPGIEVAMNKNQLDKLWEVYSVDARQRKVTGCKEIHIATRWSVHDVIGRLQRAYEGNERCRFIAVPDIDPETGESNFAFDINPFTVEFYHDQELLMDEISYRCLYKNEPIEREGLLYHEDELRRYLELPMREPDAIIGVCDTKAKGTDFMVLPAMYKYDDDYYMDDVLCNDSSDFGVQYGKMANLIVNNNMQQCEFESNTGGDRVAYEVEKIVKELGGRCNITTKPTESNKETKIIVNSDWIKKHVLFKDKSLYGPKDDYGVFMSWLLSYSVSGKNTHDDVPDTLANFALYVTKGGRVSRVEAIQNPFRNGFGGRTYGF